MPDEKKLFIVLGIAYGGGFSYLMPGRTPVHFDINLFAVAATPQDAVDSSFADQMAVLKKYREAARYIQEAKSEKAAADWLAENPEKKSLLQFPPAEPVKKENWRAREVEVLGWEIQLVKKEE